MASQSPRGVTPRALMTSLRADERRGWFSHGVAALAISALGLAAAGSMALTTSAETTQGAVAADARVASSNSVPALPNQVPGTGAAPQAKAAAAEDATQEAALQPFSPAGDVTDATANEKVRAAVVKERAAQRAEDLSKKAEDATRVTRAESSKVRSKDLAATDRATRENAVKIATERRQRAIAARVAAEAARRSAQTAAATTNSTTTTTTIPQTTAPIPSGGNGASPVPGAVIGTPFGATGLWARYHTGLDFRAAQGTPIRAVQAGVVLYAGNSGNWSGNHVAILHAGGMTTMSSHMSSMSVSAGDRVTAGQVIGRVGQTGRAFGAHLHFELYPRGVKYGDIYQAINPVPWLRANGVKTR
ncbi:MAG: M23 family metallopeptidase [Propionibacteriaceae bacterium]